MASVPSGDSPVVSVLHDAVSVSAVRPLFLANGLHRPFMRVASVSDSCSQSFHIEQHEAEPVIHLLDLHLPHSFTPDCDSNGAAIVRTRLVSAGELTDPCFHTSSLPYTAVIPIPAATYPVVVILPVIIVMSSLAVSSSSSVSPAMNLQVRLADLAGEKFKDMFYSIFDSHRSVRHNGAEQSSAQAQTAPTPQSL
jgi:hypothetical protein